MNSYTKMLKDSEKKSKEKRKLEDIRMAEQAKKDFETKTKIAIAELRQIEVERENEQKVIEYKNEIKNALVGTLPYRLWVVCWDLLNDNWLQVQCDIDRCKITIEQVQEVMNKMNSIHNIINYDFLGVA